MSWEKLCEDIHQYGKELGLTDEEIKQILKENEELLDWMKKKSE
ncbi:hypothetical protein [Bacillus licheniformis]|nr:hypothetical protein [Bacillus licheniformis]